MAATLGELAAHFGCELHGEPGFVVRGVGTLTGAGREAVTFLANSLYRSQLAATRAGAVILAPRDLAACPVASLVHPEPYLVYAQVAAFLHPPPAAVPGVHSSAVVAASARVPESAELGPQCVVGPDCQIENDVIIGAGTILGARVVVGAGTRLAPRVTIMDGVRLGARCIVHSGAVIGADGFGFAPNRGAWQKIPQLGSVVIGADVEIGANTTIDRGTIEDTVVENGVKLDNLVQIAHNVKLGEHTIIAALCGIAGSTKIGKRCMIGGASAMINQLTICDDVMVTFGSIVTRSIEVPGTYSGHLPAEESGKWRKSAARFRRLDELATRLARVERAFAKLTGMTLKDSDE